MRGVVHCAFCRQPLGYVHGHAACLDGRCPMFGVNQAECCSGDHGDCPATSTVAMRPVAEAQGAHSKTGRR